MASSDALENCKRRRKTDVDRYYQTVLLTIGLKQYLEKEEIGCRFVSAEPRFRNVESKKEILPDIVLQYDDGNRGVLCEVKTSVVAIDAYLLDELKQLESYSGEFEGWDTSKRRVLEHSIVLLCHALDSDRIVKKVTEWLNNGKLEVSKKLCIAEWGIVESLKYDQRDVFLIRHKHGETGCTALDNKLRENIRFEVDELFTVYEKCRFVRKEPPLEYTMNQLWSSIFPALHEETEDFTCSLDDILGVAYEYFIPWSGLQGEYSQIRRRWIKKAMKAFCDIGIAEEKGSHIYEISYGKRIWKDVSEYFVEKLCRRDLEEARKIKIKEISEKMQRKLAEFDKQQI